MTIPFRFILRTWWCILRQHDWDHGFYVGTIKGEQFRICFKCLRPSDREMANRLASIGRASKKAD
jgi:hypothetical protein